jgi:hypothetical protein
MTILCITRPKVKPHWSNRRPARPFGEGILDGSASGMAAPSLAEPGGGDAGPEDDGSVTPSPFARRPYTVADLRWWAENSPSNREVYDVAADGFMDADRWADQLAALANALDRLERGLDASHDHSGSFLGHPA